MTMIRIDPDELAVASSTLQSVGARIGGTTSGVRARATAGLPPTTCTEVVATLARVETTLLEVQKELVLHATLLAVRGPLAARGATDIAGAATIEAPRTTTSALGAITTAGPAATTIPQATIVGWTTVEGVPVPINAAPPVPITATPPVNPYSGPSGSPGSTSLPGLDQLDLPSSDNPFLRPEPDDFTSWSNSMTRDSDGDGRMNGYDKNPGSYDIEYTDNDSSTEPADT